MAVGLAAVTLANSWLNMLRAAAFTAPPGTYIKLHVADPGAAGTTSPSAVTTRVVATFAAASGGAIALNGTAPAFSMTTTETISHISVWDSLTVGNLLWTAALTTPKAVVNTDTLTFTTVGVSLTPLAA